MAVRKPEHKVIDLKTLCEETRRLQQSGKTVVTTNGCFDLLHWGHIKYLSQARALGDCLVVGINSDRSVRALEKGSDRPLQSEKLRALQMAGLESVDWVFVFDDDTPLSFLKEIKPNIHAKGADYASKPLPERDIVEQWGGRIELIEFVPGLSTTSLVNQIRNSRS